MALIKSGTLGSGRPLLAYELHAEQIGASGTSRTIKITGKFKVNGSSASWYGYACNWRARVHNSYGSWSSIKGTESWNGGQAYRSFSQTLTVDVGTTSSTAITVGLYTDSQIDNSWDGNATGSFTVSSTNTAPYFPSGASITVRSGGNSSGTVLSGIIPENINTVYISWTSAQDNEGGTLNYVLNHNINGGGYTQIDYGTDLAHSYNIGSGNEGQTIQYYVDCRDGAGLWSSKIYSGVLTKNRFTGDTLSSSSSISYDSTSLAFSYSGASNTNGNTSFTRVLSCDGITVYNPTVTGSSATVTIYKSGTAPTTPYIRFDDIKNKFASASYKGTLTFTLTTTNAYGTTRTSSKNISVNLQTTPNAVGSCSIATDANSTAYKTVTSTNNKYFIPDGSNIIRVNWTAGSGKLGEAISYELYVAYGSGGWSKVATLASGTLYYNHVVPKQTISQAIKYKVRTITGYGTYADRDTNAQTLHYYNPPSLAQGTLTRSATTCDVQVTVKSLSSIPNINTVGTWNCYNKGTTTSVSSGSLTVSQAVQTIKVTGLTDAGQYDLKVIFKDNTGFSTDNTKIIAIGANSPIFFVNKYGIGVNGEKADNNCAIRTKGGMDIIRSGDGASLLHFGTERGWAFKQGGTGAGASLDLVSDTGDKNFRIMPPSRNKSISFSVSDTASSSISIDGNKVYHAGSKPTPADVGLSNVNNWGASSDIGANSTSQYATTNMVAKVRGEKISYDYAGSSEHPRLIPAKGDWLRVGSNGGGLLPYSNNNSHLGTSSWRFGNIWANHLNGMKCGGGTDGSWFSSIIGVAADGVAEIGRYIDWHYSNGERKDYHSRMEVYDWDCIRFSGAIRLNGGIQPERNLQGGWDVGQNGSRFYTVYCNNVNQSSDKSLKENIVYVDDNTSTFSKMKSKTPFKDFLVGDLKIATYRYKRENKLSEEELERNPKGTDLEHREEDNQIGFIAQDVINTDIGSTFVYGEEGSMNYSPSGFTTVVAKALQEEIKEKDEKIIELESRLEKLENMIKDLLDK